MYCDFKRIYIYIIIIEYASYNGTSSEISTQFCLEGINLSQNGLNFTIFLMDAMFKNRAFRSSYR